MSKEELEKEAEKYTKKLLKKLGIKEDMLLENQPKYLRQESMNFVALDVENVTDAYIAGAEPREKRIAELEAQIEKMKCCQNCSHLCGLCELGINGCYVCSKWEVRR